MLNDALVEGMRIVGIDFRDGILFVPEVLLAANAMKAGMAILRPLLAETGAEPIGSVVIGTVKGDIHDIGKNLVAMMLEGAGFEVFDLGINTDADEFLAALDEHQPDILGMSALLTTTMPYMKVVIDTLTEKGIRDNFIILVGGAPLNEEFGSAIGAGRLLPRRRHRGRDGQELRIGPPGRRMTVEPEAGLSRVLVIGCGALVRELQAVAALNEHLEVECLPAVMHNRPEKIPDAVRRQGPGRQGPRRLQHDPRGLHGLRHGRAARPGVLRGGRRAAARRPLLRALRRRGRLRRPAGGRAGHLPTSPTTWCGTSTG